MKAIKKLSNAEIASFCEQTAMILNAGISPAEGMNILLQDTDSNDGKDLITMIRDTCYQGEKFYTAVQQTNVFPDYVLNMIRLGEESGNLDDTMQALADYYEQQEAISDSIKNAVSYPFIMIAMMLLVIIVLITQVLPIFNQVFMQLGSEMNGFSQSLLRIGNTLRNSSAILIALLVICVGCYFIFTKTSRGKKVFNTFLVKFPLTAKFYEDVSYSRFASGMALTMSSGMDTYESLDLVYELVDDTKMQEKITLCKSLILEGSNFAESLTKADIFSNLYGRMISVAFQAGALDTAMKRIANNYERDVEKRIHTIISVLEPTLVIILSLIVGLILLSVILPLLGIMSSIG